MSIDDLIKQLEDLRCHCEEMEQENKDEKDNIWERDTKALTAAIGIIKDYKTSMRVEFIAL